MPITVSPNNKDGPDHTTEAGLRVPGSAPKPANSDLPSVGAAVGTEFESGTPSPTVQAKAPTPDFMQQDEVIEDDKAAPVPDFMAQDEVVKDDSPLSAPDFEQPETPAPEGFEPTRTEQIVNQTVFGRVLDAFGEGWQDGFGDSRVGFDDDTLKVIEDAGLIGKPDGTAASLFRSFNETFILPLINAPVAALEATGRAIEGGVKSVAKGAGQVALEAGADPGMAKRLTRDVVGFAETVGVVTAALPPSMAVKATTTNTVRKVVHSDKKAAEAVKKAPAEVRVRAERESVFEPFDNFDDANVSPVAPQAEFRSVGASAVPEPGNLNLSRINAPEDVKDVLRSTAIANGGFQDARRGVMTFEETESLASVIGITPKDLAKVQKGQTFNAEELLAARQLLVASAHNVRDFAKKATGGDDAALVAYREAALRHQAIQEQVAGLTAEAGRALSSLRIMAGEARDAKALSAVIESGTSRADLLDQARAVAVMDDPAALSKTLMDARKATKGDMFIEAWINGLLSGPKTHVANMVGNTLTVLNSAAETAVAAGIGAVRNVATGGKATERVRMGEVTSELFGILQGSVDGVKLGAKAFATELPSDAIAKLEQTRRQAIPSIKIGKFELGGKQARIPSRLLMAEDELFKAMARRQKINALAYRTADAEGLSGVAKADRIADLVASPTKAMKAEADAHALTVTFQNPLGKLGNATMAWANSHPVAKVIVPFVRTPINILKYPVKRTPLGVFSKEVRENLNGKNGAIARDQEAARMILGTSIASTAAYLAGQGLITGSGPSDPSERALLRATGWQPHSIKIGDSYHSFARFEPIAMYLGVAADAYDLMSKAGKEDMTEEERDDLAIAVVGAFSKNALDKTFTKGVADVVKALTDPDRYGESYLRRLSGTVVPSALSQTAQAVDPMVREARTVVDTLKSRLPGLSKDLLPKRDIWGQKIIRGGAVGPDLVSTIYTSRMKHDPVLKELLAIGYFPSQVRRKVSGVELTAEEYDRLQKVTGVLTRQALTKVMKLKEWSKQTVDGRAKIARDVVNATRQKARNYVVLESRDLRKRIEAAALERRRKLTGEGE